MNTKNEKIKEIEKEIEKEEKIEENKKVPEGIFWKKLYIDFFNEHAFVFFIYFLIIVFLFPIEGLIQPNIYGKLFEGIKKTGISAGFFDIFENILKLNVPGLMILIAFSWFMVIVTDYLKGECEAYITPKYLQYVRSIFFEGTIQKHDSGNFKDIKAGEYIARIMELSRNLRDSFQYMFSRFFPEALVTFIIIVYLLCNNNTVGIIIGVSTILCLIIMISYGSALLDLVIKKEHHFISEISENLTNNFNNLMNVYINNNNKETVDTNVKLEKENERLTVEIMNLENLAILSTQFITVSAYTISLYYIYKGMKNKSLPISIGISTILVLGNYLTYVMDLNWGIVHQIIYKMGIVLASQTELEEIFSAIETDKKDADFKGNSIKFNNISFKYDETQEDWLFENFNFHIKDNEKIAILGRSGSGKTTLVKMLVKLHIPNEGTIEIDGQNIDQFSKQSLRDNVNYVNQKTNLFNDTLMFNLKYGNNKTDQEIEQILKKYKLDELFSELTDGYDTNVGINGGNLSLGMQKVTTLIRGISKDCKIIIFDEPLAGLDEKTRVKVIKLILNECRNKTLIVITHDKEILPHMDRVINLNQLQGKDKHVENKQEGFRNYMSLY